MSYKLVTKRATDKELLHYDVYHDEKYIGYIISEDSNFRAPSSKWAYVSNYPANPAYGMTGSTKKELLAKIEKARNYVNI